MPKPLVITEHARHAMQLRRVSLDEVLEILAHPEVTDRDTQGNQRYFKGRLCVVTKTGSFKITVKTVLYRYANTWTDEDVRKRTDIR